MQVPRLQQKSIMKEKTFLFVIGLQKCGTTTLYRWLLEHSDELNINTKVKELNYFSATDSSCSEKDYVETYFDGNRSDLVYVDVSPAYGYTLDCVEAISKLEGRKIIVVLYRNICDRVISAYSMHNRRKHARGDLNTCLRYELAAFKEVFDPHFDEYAYISSSLFSDIGEYFKNNVSNSSLHYFDLQDIEATPAKVYIELCGLIGLVPRDNLLAVGQKFHAGGSIKYHSLDKALRVLKKLITWRPKFAQGFGYWFEQWNIKQEVSSFIIDPDVRKALEKIENEQRAKLENEELW